jgi:uncharacterized protein
MNRTILIIGFAALFVAGCSTGDADTGGVDASYADEINEWRDSRMVALKAENGYLNLAGLFWLEDGTSSFGSAEDNDIQFPPSAPAHIGEFELTEDGVRMTVLGDADVRVDGERVESILMLDDTTETPVTVTMASMAWLVVHRERQFAVRLRDFEHRALTELPPIPFFDIDPEWRVEAEMRYFDEPRVMNVGTVIEGLGYNPVSPGVMVFTYAGVEYELEAYDVTEDLFFVFGDLTNRGDTYPAGRFLHAAFPDENGMTVLDFNKSYNPPCAFGDFSTCPVASPKNRLPIRMEAGEKFVPELHVSTLVKH